MKLLLDESVPRRLGRELTGHEVSTVQEQGWASFENGDLLRLASGAFDVLVTCDQNLEHQQNIASFRIGLLVLVARTNRLEDLRPLVAPALRSLATLKPGVLIRVES